MRSRDVSQANLNVRVPLAMHRKLTAAAERRGQSVSEYLRPMLGYLATLDDEDPIWGDLKYMRLPRIERVPVGRN